MPGLGISFGRGGATTFQQDLKNADVIVIQGSNMAECHPVGFQWVMEAKARGAKPRFESVQLAIHRLAFGQRSGPLFPCLEHRRFIEGITLLPVVKRS